MPFKSEAQRRFFHAATEPGFRGKAHITKTDVKKWEKDTPKHKKLPERLHRKKKAFEVIAHELGKQAALEKVAGIPEGIIDALGKHVNVWAPALAGSYLAGPGYRFEGALAGGLAGHLGGRVGSRFNLRNLKGAEKYFEGAPAGAYENAIRTIESGEAIPGLVNPKELGQVQRSLRAGRTVGAIGGGAAGGYGVGRILGSQNPYGMQPVFPGLDKENPMGIRPE